MSKHKKRNDARIYANSYARIYAKSMMNHKQTYDDQYETALAKENEIDGALHEQIATIIVSEGLLSSSHWYVYFDIEQNDQQIVLTSGSVKSCRDRHQRLFDLVVNDALFTYNTFGINYYEVKSQDFNFVLSIRVNEKGTSAFSHASITLLDESQLAETVRAIGVKVKTSPYPESTIGAITNIMSELMKKHDKLQNRLEWYKSLPKST